MMVAPPNCSGVPEVGFLVSRSLVWYGERHGALFEVLVPSRPRGRGSFLPPARILQCLRCIALISRARDAHVLHRWQPNARAHTRSLACSLAHTQTIPLATLRCLGAAVKIVRPWKAGDRDQLLADDQLMERLVNTRTQGWRIGFMFCRKQESKRSMSKEKAAELMQDFFASRRAERAEEQVVMRRRRVRGCQE